MKRRAKIQRFIGLMTIKTILAAVCDNFMIWKERNRQKLNQFFLALNFKYRFRKNFYKMYGFEYKHRLVNYSRRVLTFNALMLSRI